MNFLKRLIALFRPRPREKYIAYVPVSRARELLKEHCDYIERHYGRDDTGQALLKAITGCKVKNSDGGFVLTFRNLIHATEVRLKYDIKVIEDLS
jgi:hypothetical protein